MGRPRRDERYLRDLYTFAKDVCGFTAMSPKLHGEICERLTDAFVNGHYNQAILIPRDFLKSSLGRATTLWMFTREVYLKENYEWRTLIDTATLTLACKHVNWIARTLYSNKLYRELYGKLYSKSKADFGREIFIDPRAKTEGVRTEPNFLASAVRTEITGLHFDVQWHDDLVGERNWHSKALRQATTRHFYSSLDLLEPDGLLLYTATTWHDGDLTGELTRAEAERASKGQKKFFDFYKRYALENEKGEPDDVNGESTFPERWPSELLYEKKATMEAAGKKFMWRAQHMMDPAVPEDSIRFDKATMYAPLASFPYMKWRFITVDPNFRDDDREGGDYAAIVVGGFDNGANWWGMDVRLGRWKSEDFIEQLFDVNRTWRPHLFRMEKKFTSHLMTAIHHQESIRGEVLPITLIDRDWRAKEMRYAGLSAIFSSRRIKFAMEIPRHIKDEMEEELERTGSSAHDDFLDALTDQFTTFAPNVTDEEESEKTPEEQVRGLKALGQMTPEMMGFVRMTEPSPEPEEEKWWQLPN
jgi:hypothetical protein